MSARQIIVTGGAGFIGSNAVARLAARGDADIIVCDRFGHAEEGKWRYLTGHDIADVLAPEGLFEHLDRHWRDVAAVVHMGAISATTETDVDLVLATNLTLSRRIWDWAVLRQRPLVYASSAATYGDGSAGFRDDNDHAALVALKPLNAYGLSKKLFDLYASRQASRGLAPPHWSGLKFFNVYGPNEGHKGSMKSVIAHMHPKAAAGEAVRLFRSHHPDYADGGQLRDFVYVRDCVDVIEWLLTSATGAGVLNVGTGRARSFLDLAGAVFGALGQKKPNIEWVDTPAEIRANYQYFTEADLTRLRGLGFDKQFTPLEAGVKDYVKNHLVSSLPGS